MTVSSDVARWSYNGDASTTAFAYTTKIFAKTDLNVYQDGTLKTVDTHYTVSGLLSATGGNVTFLSAPGAGTGNVVIEKAIPNTQGSSLPLGGPFPSTTVETALDRLTFLVQQVVKKVTRSLRQDPSDASDIAALPVKATRATKLLGFDANGDPTVSTNTLATLDSSTTAAAVSAAAAASSASAASSSASAASTSATNAASSATAAAASAASLNVHSLTQKSSPVGADELLVADSAASFIHKRSTITQVLAAASAFASTTAMLFAQASAPTGWTKSTTHNDKALRVVSGTPSSGGSTAFSTVMASRTPTGTIAVNAVTLSTANLASHSHSGGAAAPIGLGNFGCGGSFSAVNAQQATGNNGSGTAFTPTGSFTGVALDFAVAYVDVMIATKD